MEQQDSYPVVQPGYTFRSVTDKITSIVMTPLKRTPRFWWVGFIIGFLIFQGFLVGVTWLFYKGVGVFGIRIPTVWGFDIANFVWWIGIGHAGTLISAFLLLMRQHWRTSINRYAEAMTLFAVMNAGFYPLLHMGRPWYFYYLVPYPNPMGLWPQFRSPLVWDFFAITSYILVSLLFWLMGLIPDLATMRDKATNPMLRRLLGIASMGWRGSAQHWRRFESAYFLMAALATPLVVSVHSIVSMDFAFAQLPGWHSTIFPPYFVIGAIFSGFAMVTTIAIPLRKYYHLEDFITNRHLDNMAKVMLAMGLIVTYSYLVELFMSWYSGDVFEMGTFQDRLTGFYGQLYWVLVSCNMIVPQLLWFKKIRVSPVPLLFVSILVNVGMWLERFIIIVQSESHDFLPTSWGLYFPTVIDVIIFLGTMGLFLTMLMLFFRALPAISIFEMRELVHRESKESHTPTPGD